MKLAVPSETDEGLESRRSGHFGHCAYFTLLEIEDGEIKSVSSVKNVDHDAVGCGGVIQYAIDLGIDAILAAGMGYPPFSRFSECGVHVYIDRTVPKVGQAVQLLLEGKVPDMTEDQACRH